MCIHKYHTIFFGIICFSLAHILLTVSFLIVNINREWNRDFIVRGPDGASWTYKPGQNIVVYHFYNIIITLIIIFMAKKMLKKQPSKKRIKFTINTGIILTLPSTVLSLIEFIFSCVYSSSDGFFSCYDSTGPLTILMDINLHFMLLVYSLWILHRIKKQCCKRKKESLPFILPFERYSGENDDLNNI